MPRTYLPLLPIPVLAVIFAVAACSRTHSEEAVAHVIPPPSSYFEVADGASSATPASAKVLAADPTVVDDAKPSADEVAAFERVVPK